MKNPEPETIRTGAPYDNPAFESLCREHGIWGTAEAALCAVFWRDATTELEAKDAALEVCRGDVAMPVIAYLRATPEGQPIMSEDCVCEDPVFPSDPEGSDADSVSMPLVRLADARAALAAKDAEIFELLDDLADAKVTANKNGIAAINAQAALKSELARPESTIVGLLRAEIASLTAERDALLVAAKYAEHIDATPENQLQTMLHDTLTERDALRKDAEILPIAINALAEWVDAVNVNGTGWDDWDEHFKEAAFRPGPLRELIDKSLAAMTKETK